MKNYLMGLIALVLAAGFTAFREHSTKKSGTKFFKLIVQSDETDRDAKVDPSSWQLSGSGGSGISCDMDEDHLCQIQAEEDGNTGKPQIPAASPLYNALYTSSVPAPDDNPRIDTYSGEE